MTISDDNIPQFLSLYSLGCPDDARVECILDGKAAPEDIRDALNRADAKVRIYEGGQSPPVGLLRLVEELRAMLNRDGVPLKSGDIVTAVDALEGAPTWVGEVVILAGLGCYREHVDVTELGSETRQRWTGSLRPLTDAEAVGMAAGITFGTWVEDWYDGVLWTLQGPDGIEVITSDWTGWYLWHGRDNLAGSGIGDADDSNQANASRALIAYTIKGRP